MAWPAAARERERALRDDDREREQALREDYRERERALREDYRERERALREGALWSPGNPIWNYAGSRTRISWKVVPICSCHSR